MEKTKVKVIAVNIGKFDCDSMTVLLDGVNTEICFEKEHNIIQYESKEIYLSKDKGIYKITNIEVSTHKK